MLKIDVKIDYKEAEVEGYGLVEVRPFGAGEELELARIGEEINGLQESIDALKDKKETKETKAQLQEIFDKVRKSTEKLHKIIAKSFKSDDPEVAERPVNELPTPELARVQKEILANA